jgi:hypothetical protein
MKGACAYCGLKRKLTRWGRGRWLCAECLAEAEAPVPFQPRDDRTFSTPSCGSLSEREDPR